jgi:hypothetical protein
MEEGLSFTGIFTCLAALAELGHCSVIARPLLAYCDSADRFTLIVEWLMMNSFDLLIYSFPLLIYQLVSCSPDSSAFAANRSFSIYRAFMGWILRIASVRELTWSLL